MNKILNFIKRILCFFPKKIILWYRLWRLKKQLPNLQCVYRELYTNNVIDYGRGNRVVIEEGGCLSKCNITFQGNNCTLHIGRNVVIRDGNSFVFEDDGGYISINDNTTMESRNSIASCEGKSITIGRDCMLSHDIDIRNTDSHSILNCKGERINPSEDICIGNHVWIGMRCIILKGSNIPSESIVAAQSMVTKSLKAPEHSLIGGIPAKLIKSDVSWIRERM